MADLSNQKKLSVYNNTNNRVVLNNNGIVEIGSKKYDISTQINDLIKDISAMSNNVDAKLLNENICMVANGKRKQYKGFTFKYVNQFEL